MQYLFVLIFIAIVIAVGGTVIYALAWAGYNNSFLNTLHFRGRKSKLLLYLVAAYPFLSLLSVIIWHIPITSEDSINTPDKMSNTLQFCSIHLVLSTMAMMASQHLNTFRKRNVIFVIANWIAGSIYLFMVMTLGFILLKLRFG